MKTIYSPRRKSRGFASNTVLMMGGLLISLMASAIAVDMGTYFTAQAQLQNSVDAAALAGAAKLPLGEQQAIDEATDLAQMNPVAGQTIPADNLSFDSAGNTFKVTGEMPVDTIFGKLLQGGCLEIVNDSETDEPCGSMTVMAGAKAAPAARDTILVIDTSSSMTVTNSNGKTAIQNVKNASTDFVKMIANFNSESIDRIGLVSFDKTATLRIGLTSQQQSAAFSSVKSKISALSTYSGSGWNTNYEAGLTTAITEMKNNGRKNAKKAIIFLTDGAPNLPAPSAYTSYSSSSPISLCADAINNSPGVKALCTVKWVNGKKQTTCPVVYNSKITPALVSAATVKVNGQTISGEKCGKDYTDNIYNKVKAQVALAEAADIVIHTITIGDTEPDNSQQILSQVSNQSSWDGGPLLDYMASSTNGESYEAANYNLAQIQDTYDAIAQDINIKLSEN